MGISEGGEWEPWGGLGDNAATKLKAFIAESPLTRKSPEPVARAVAVPAVAAPDGAEQSTQAAFGRILLDLAKSGDELADRIVTTAPDVTQTTNLGAFVNQRGLFRRRSEEHTSELQSLMRISYAVFCLKKKNTHKNK